MSYNNNQRGGGGGAKCDTVAVVLNKPNSQSIYTKPGEPVIMVYKQDPQGNLTDTRQYLRIDWEKFRCSGWKIVYEGQPNEQMLGKKIGISQNVRVQQRNNYGNQGQQNQNYNNNQQYNNQNQHQQYQPPQQQTAPQQQAPAPQGGNGNAPTGADVQQPQQTAPTNNPDMPF